MNIEEDIRKRIDSKIAFNENTLTVSYDCISVNTNWKQLLQANEYNYSGVNLVLKSPLMKNRTQIIYIGMEQAQITMKSYNEQSSTNYIPIFIQANNQNISNTFLNDIFDHIFVEVDYCFDGLI